RLEDPVSPLRREARAVVGDLEEHASTVAPTGQEDPPAGRRVLRPVLEEVFEDATQQVGGSDGVERPLPERGLQPVEPEDRRERADGPFDDRDDVYRADLRRFLGQEAEARGSARRPGGTAGGGPSGR